MTDRKLEDEFREAVIKYLRGNKILGERALLANFVIIGDSRNIDEEGTSTVSFCANPEAPFVLQVGMVEYAGQMLKSDIVRREAGDIDEED